MLALPSVFAIALGRESHLVHTLHLYTCRAVLAKEGVAVDLATSIAQAYAAQLKNLRELHKGPGTGAFP